MRHAWIVLSALLLCTGVSSARITRGAQSVNLWKLNQLRNSNTAANFVIQNGWIPTPEEEYPEFPEQYFTQPLDHFSNETMDTFGQRYWVNTRHYKPGMGGPVIVLDGGEITGEVRLPFLDTGIVDILAKATGGVGVVLEHRYYGKSVPVANFSTDALRWLNNDQSAADSANFMANVKFDEIDEDLTAPGTPWIYYGGSYAGARAAHMRVLYPELVYGAIASSAVTHAQVEMWEYTDVIRRAMDPECAKAMEDSIKTIDFMLDNSLTRPLIKKLFGLSDVAHDEDVVAVISTPTEYWQEKVWDPEVGSTAFDDFCTDLLGQSESGQELLEDLDDTTRSILPILNPALLNYAKHIREKVVALCPEDKNTEECFGTYNDTGFQNIGLDQDWRLWNFQVCTEWGYFFTAPPEPYPRIVSKLLTLDYASKFCRQAFPTGKHFAVPRLPNITAVNSLGDFAIAADRLAIIDGEVDPWRPMTPHAEGVARDREDTLTRPFKIIPGGVHHYDEYGLADIAQEPAEIRKIHGEMIVFVMEWLKAWDIDVSGKGVDQ